MKYTNSTTNYTNIDTEKSVHFAVPRTETRLKNASDLYMKYRSYAGPVLASAVWTDEKKNNTELFL